MEHLQNLDNVLADVERAGATISGYNSNWCWNGVTTLKRDMTRGNVSAVG